MKNNRLLIAFLWVVLIGGLVWILKPGEAADLDWVATVQKKAFSVDVRTVGVLEAERSLVVFSSIRGDQGKIIDLVPDGKQVQKDEVLVRLDPTPFEHKLAEIEAKIRDQNAAIAACEHTLDMEISKAELEKQTAQFEMENAGIEVQKLADGDGLVERAKLETAFLKAKSEYEEVSAFEGELDRLAEKGVLNPGEKKQALKKLREAKDAYEAAKMELDNFVERSFPLQLKKAELARQKAEIKLDDTIKSARFRVIKAEESLLQHQLGLRYLENERAQALHELAMTEIKAPAPGMAVLREEFRSGERRKPRTGDLVIKNQPLLNLPDMSSVVVKTKVREVDLHKVGVGKKASIEIDAYPHLKPTGEVVSIGVLAVNERQAMGDKVFEVVVKLDQPHAALRPGMTARVTIHSADVDGSRVVPLHAVFSKKNQHYCYRKTMGGFKETPVSLGAHNENWVEILEGLKEGDQVALIDPDLSR